LNSFSTIIQALKTTTLDGVRKLKGDIIFTTLKGFIDWVAKYLVMDWARRNSIFPLPVGQMCCALEMGATMACRWDIDRMGILPRTSPRQCDLILVNGPITKKMAKRYKLLYDQLPDPKWVLAMGECAISGGPFAESYSVVRGAKEVFPVDVYVPGCPPHPEALIRGCQELQSIIRHGKDRRSRKLIGYFDELIHDLGEQPTKDEVKSKD
jgi:NADH-quinone oxidoreductase subunit B